MMGEKQQRAVQLVREGLTFSEAAEQAGLTRNAVAGACDRAGVKAEWTPRKKERQGNLCARNQQGRWMKPGARERHAEWFAKNREAFRAKMQDVARKYWTPERRQAKAAWMRAMHAARKEART